MEVRSSDRWVPGEKTNATSNKSYSAGSVVLLVVCACVLTVGAAAFLEVFRPAAAATDQSAIEDSSRREINQIQRDLVATMNRVTLLEQDNQRLTAEVQLLTGQNGVLSGVIAQIRSLKGQNEYFKRDLLGALETDPELSGEMPSEDDALLSQAGMKGPRARHLVVTPRAAPAAPAKSGGSDDAGDGEKAE